MIFKKKFSSIKRVLIYVDQKRRDSYPSIRIYKELIKSGIEVKIAGKISFLPLLASWKPHVILFGKHDGFHGDWIRSICNTYIFSLGTEQGSTYESFIEKAWFQGHSYPRPPAHDKVDCFLVYNEFTKNYIKSKLQLSKVEVIGSPRLYSKKLHKIARPLKNENLTIGIICGEDKTNFSQALAYFKNYFYKEKSFPDFFSDFNNLQGILTFWLLEKLFLNFLIERLKKEFPKAKFLARVRYDSNKSYIENSEGIEFDQSADPSSFIEICDVVITSQSTLGFECMMAGIPAISIIKQINPGTFYKNLIARNFTRSLHQPETLDDISNLINKRLIEKLPISPRLDDFLVTSKNCFFDNLEVDKSMEKITELVKKTPIKDNDGAQLNKKKLFHLLDETSSITKPQKIWIILCMFNPIFFSVGNLLARFRYRDSFYFQ